MKKCLWISLAALGFVACEKGIDNDNPQNGEMEQSYIAISLASAEMGTRAEGATYEDGEAAERTVNSASVFFFTDGNAFTNVNGNGKNYQEIDLTPNAQDPEDDNVSDITNKVLVIESYNGELPNQIVAVLNWTPTANTYSIAELKAAVTDYKSTVDGVDYFVMSNAVYKDQSGEVYATPLSYSDFKNTKAAAEAAPVQIYVERVAAKVQFSTPGDLYDENSNPVDAQKQVFKLKESKDSSAPIKVDDKDLYAKILGWELYQEGQDSYLLKNIDPSWGIDAELYGFKWNDPYDHRSYWAVSKDRDNDDTFRGLNEELPTHIYCCENTKQDEAKYTKVIVTAELQDKDGNAVPVARWFGHDYVGMTNLLTAVQNTLSNTYYTSTDGTTFTSITSADITNVMGADITGGKQYQTYFQLSDAGKAKVWYKRNGNAMDKLTTVDTDPANLVQTEINTQLAAIAPALFYENGRTYYYTNIKHLGTANGVVRNHIYDVKINSIAGFGTPVLSDDITDTTIETPETPEEVKETFLAAQINILSWRVVDNNTDL